MIWTILLIIVALIAGYIIIVYNRLIRLQNLVKEGWSGIDVQLKRRTDLIPNLVEMVKGYMLHERGVLEKVTELRVQALASSSIEERVSNENMLTQALRQLFAVVENYPNLKASQNFVELQQTLADVENQIQLARRYYNGTVRDFNVIIESFPSNIVAITFHFMPEPFSQIENIQEREVPNVKFP